MMEGRTYKLVSSLTIISIVGASPLTRNESTNASTRDDRVFDCSLKAQRIGTILGSLLLIETVFCCIVLYRWIRKYRISISKTKQQQMNDEGNVDQPIYTEADGSDPQQPITVTDSSKPQQPINSHIRNYQHLVEPKPTGYQSLAKNNSGTRRGGSIINRMRILLFGHRTPSQTEAVKNEVYYEPTDNGASNDTEHAQVKDDVFYHVLEDPDSKLPQGNQNENPDSLYYSSEDCIEAVTLNTTRQPLDEAYYHVLEDPENQVPQGTQGSESLYYSSEDCVESVLKNIAPEGLKPLPYVPKGKIENKKPIKPSQNRLPCFYILDSKAGKTPASQVAKPMNCKPGLQDNVIEEMKSELSKTKSREIKARLSKTRSK